MLSKNNLSASVVVLNSRKTVASPFLNQARAAKAWFLEIALVHALVCVCVCMRVSACLPLRELLTSGVIWCDIGHVRLVKQVSWLFPAFNYFI